MDFYQVLGENHSKSTTNLIVDVIVAHPEKMNDLIALFLMEDVKMSQRASWPIAFIAEKNPLIIEVHLDELFTKLDQKEVHDACIRSLFRALQYIKIPPHLEGKILNKAFEYLNDSKSAIAIKVFCLDALFQLSLKYPEIKNELVATIVNQLEEGGPAFKSRGTKILKKLNK